ncbi:hypothetical protein GGR56DRAFT_676585 [Xylariaceae sp. FL0804]|nr:hypothetical protein GGR56DRAFT_676585 [Xylariaceae sp. FL0804]
MQPRRAEVVDIDLSIRFKHGIHTICLFVDPNKSFSHVQEELLETLRERYPQGLTTAVFPRKKTTKLPSSASQLSFAVPKSAVDTSQGWVPLKISKGDSPASQGLKDNMMVAFAITPDDAVKEEDEDEDQVVFEVDFPKYDYDDAEEQ